MTSPDLAALAGDLARVARGVVRLGEPLAPHSTIRLGGPAGLWFAPAGPDDLLAGLALLRGRSVPLLVLGGGANTLISDAGFLGVVVHLGPGFGPKVAWVGDQEAELPAGLNGIKALQCARSRGLLGPEFLVGIPGTLGGQTRMNAGTPRGQIAELLTAVQLADADGLRWVPADRLGFAYRHSALPDRGAGPAVIARVRLRFRTGDLAAADAELRADLAYRRRTQPWRWPNLGSTFRNPPRDFAGRLLEQAGLKGRQLGQMAFSSLHANWLTNLGGGLAAEARALIDTAIAEVAAASGVTLTLEVALAGTF